MPVACWGIGYDVVATGLACKDFHKQADDWRACVFGIRNGLAAILDDVAFDSPGMNAFMNSRATLPSCLLSTAIAATIPLMSAAVLQKAMCTVQAVLPTGAFQFVQELLSEGLDIFELKRIMASQIVADVLP